MVTFEITVESRIGDVVLTPVEIIDTVDIGVLAAPETVFVEVQAGPAGPPGPRGSGAQHPKAFYFSQPQQTWLCPHNLGYYPASVTVVDGERNKLLSSYTYDNINTIRVEFGQPMVGAVFII